MFDEISYNFVPFQFELHEIERGWHQFFITVDNDNKKSTLYVNGAKIDEIQVEVRKNIKYICNSCDGNNPIGCILDL
jgi:hypothetical protein